MRKFGSNVKVSKPTDWTAERPENRACFRDRSAEALDAAIDSANKSAAFMAQHGPVRSLMVNGKPGPDAPKVTA